jgi:hypothetical protein
MSSVAWGNNDKRENDFFYYRSTINIVSNEIMIIKAILNIVIVWLLLTTLAMAEEKKVDTEVKELSGISIIGNKEAPKSLYIVPWQDSEVGVATSLNSGLLDDSMRPLDKEVFLRELDFYELSHGRK